MGFSLWCDFIEADFLDGEFLQLLRRGVNGATSNPAIFKQALLSPAYKSRITKATGKDAKQIYESLVCEDIARAAERLAPLFAAGNDGFISLEIDPRLHENTAASLAEARRLHRAIGLANVMIKVPATPASYEVMSELMAEGISVNATLVFSLEQNQRCCEALLAGLGKFQAQNPGQEPGLPDARPPGPQGVISIFVSRFDRLLNPRVSIPNRIGVLNANLAYNNILRNAEPSIRPLFASTGVKDEGLAGDLYIRELLFENSINTAPLDAIRAFNADLHALRGGGAETAANGGGAAGGTDLFKAPLSNSQIYTELNALLPVAEREAAASELLTQGLGQFCQAFEDILAAL